MNRTDKILLAAMVALIGGMAALGFLFFRDPALFLGSNASPAPTSEPAPDPKTAPAPVNKPANSTEVTYSDQKGFTPNTVTIQAGQTVSWINNREARPMWVASDVHPSHEKLPEFDTAKVLGRFPKPGEDFSFTFEKSGTWTYHDHADASRTGTVIVK